MASGLCLFRALLHLLAQPARLRKGAIIKRDRALMIVNGKNVEGACALLQHVVVDVRDEDADQAPVLVVEDVA
jgi:hypothetical protein